MPFCESLSSEQHSIMDGQPVECGFVAFLPQRFSGKDESFSRFGFGRASLSSLLLVHPPLSLEHCPFVALSLARPTDPPRARHGYRLTHPRLASVPPSPLSPPPRPSYYGYRITDAPTPSSGLRWIGLGLLSPLSPFRPSAVLSARLYVERRDSYTHHNR